VGRYVQALSHLSGGSGGSAAKSRACREAMASTYSWAKTIDAFERILDEAQAAIPDRRCRFAAPMVRELAALALECQGFADSFELLRYQGRSCDPLPGMPVGLPFRLVARFCNGPFGRVLLANPALKRVGRTIVYRLLTRGQGDRS